MVEERIKTVETRLDKVESDLSKLRKTTHRVANAQMRHARALTKIEQNTERMLSFYEGTDKVFGFCRKHWRTALKFGCGVVTAYGFSNPAVGRVVSFIGKFFGL